MSEDITNWDRIVALGVEDDAELIMEFANDQGWDQWEQAEWYLMGECDGSDVVEVLENDKETAIMLLKDDQDFQLWMAEQCGFDPFNVLAMGLNPSPSGEAFRFFALLSFGDGKVPYGLAQSF